mgnify:CR=1 FL=1
MKPPAEGPPERPPERSPERPPEHELAERPRGLLGLLLWPLQVAIATGLRLFAALVSGILSAFLPAEKKEPREPPE